jgi:hypothetical protein
MAVRGEPADCGMIASPILGYFSAAAAFAFVSLLLKTFHLEVKLCKSCRLSHPPM